MADARTRILGNMLLRACGDGDTAAMDRLLPVGGTELDLSGPAFQIPDTKSTPLIVAAKRGHTDIVRMILERAPNTLTWRKRSVRVEPTNPRGRRLASTRTAR
jgi:hypothetical protein